MVSRQTIYRVLKAARGRLLVPQVLTSALSRRITECAVWPKWNAAFRKSSKSRPNATTSSCGYRMAATAQRAEGQLLARTVRRHSAGQNCTKVRPSFSNGRSSNLARTKSTASIRTTAANTKAQPIMRLEWPVLKTVSTKNSPVPPVDQRQSRTDNSENYVNLSKTTGSLHLNEESSGRPNFPHAYSFIWRTYALTLFPICP